MTSTATQAALAAARARLAATIETGCRNGAFTPGRLDMGATVEANNRLAWRQGLYTELAAVRALEAHLATPEPADLDCVACDDVGSTRPAVGFSARLRLPLCGRCLVTAQVLGR